MSPPARPLVAVLGASGYLGSAVAAELAARPLRLRLVGRRRCAPPADAAASVETREVDLTAPGEAARAVADADAVVHLVAHTTDAANWRAAELDPHAERINVGLMRSVVEALRAQHRPGRRPPTVVFAGSVSQVGRSGPVDGSEPDEPVTVYARQKLAAERLLTAATAEGLLRGVSLRLPTVYGRGPGPQGRGVVLAMTHRALAGEPLTLWGTGAVERDLLHVADAARAVAACLDHADELAGRHWPVGTGDPVTVAQLFTAIARSVAARTGRPPVPVRCVEPPRTATETDARGTVVDSSAFRSVTGWRPRMPLRQALDDLVAALA
ncbi:NAD-dependent epimerase/dehydratase family protein [Kitasatospora sp. NPDC101157]|uniref:NAD-dependent epimerase/dehydratase family protein n=1 Tax=Kitasatospora sp. NPDC101157 TaxID=3364098 RepID=UPI0038016058